MTKSLIEVSFTETERFSLFPSIDVFLCSFSRRSNLQEHLLGISSRTIRASISGATFCLPHSHNNRWQLSLQWAIVLFALVYSTGPINADEQIEDYGNCPIKPEQPASAEYSYDHKGITYYFCCQSCVRDFKSDPDRFVAPPAPVDQSEELPEAPPNYPPIPAKVSGQLVWLLNRPVVVVHFVLVLGILGLCVLRSRLNNAVWGCVIGLGVIDIFCLVGNLALRDFKHASELANAVEEVVVYGLPTTQELKTLEESVHYTTLQKFGRPVRPVKHPDKPASLSATYYRGNDERSSYMMNEGNYRTVTLNIKLIHANEEDVEYSQPVDVEKLAIRITIDRASGTSSGYFTEDYMKRMYLTQSSDPTMGSTAPVPDRVALVTTKPGQQWEGTFSIAPSNVSVNDNLSGIVYVCEERYSTPQHELLGGRFHYAIEFDLRIKDGQIQPSSDIWMGATYEGREFDTMRITPDEWLSLEPLPELPAEKQ